MTDNTIVDAIKNSLAKEVAEEYDKYVQNCIVDMHHRFQVMKNEIVKSVLDGIDVSITQQEKSLEPIIQIKIIKQISKEDI